MEERNAVLKSEGARGARMTYNMRKEKKGNMSFLEDMGKWTLVWTKPHPSVQILTLSISKVLGWVKVGVRWRYMQHPQVPGTSSRGGHIQTRAPGLGSKGPMGAGIHRRYSRDGLWTRDGSILSALARKCQAGFDPCKWDYFPCSVALGGA